MMRNSLVFALLASVVVATTQVDALATSGWDRHSVDIEGDYRIHSGFHGLSMVSRLDAEGNPIDPPLAEFLPVPQYLVTSSHLILRGETLILSEEATRSDGTSLRTPQLRFVAIRKSDFVVIGPMTGDEFSSSSFNMDDSPDWLTPKTASDSFTQFVLVTMILGVCLILALVSIPFIVFFRLRKRKQQAVPPA